MVLRKLLNASKIQGYVWNQEYKERKSKWYVNMSSYFRTIKPTSNNSSFFCQEKNADYFSKEEELFLKLAIQASLAEECQEKEFPGTKFFKKLLYLTIQL